jgi:hypothetical protein
MGSTTVEWKGRGFEAADASLSVWLELLVREIRAIEDAPAWLRDAADDWHLQATAGFGFGVEPALDRIVVDDERRHAIIEISERVLTSLDAWSDPVSADFLNELEVGGPDGFFPSDLPVEMFRRVGRYFVKLLEGSLAAGEVDSRLLWDDQPS